MLKSLGINYKLAWFGAVALTCAFHRPVLAQGTAFTYQGQLKQSGVPFTGMVDLDCSLWDADTAGNQVGATINLPGVSVTNGLFTVAVNAGGEFGATAFNGEPRWLEISVNGTPLSPRQALTAAPNSLFALNADKVDGLDSTSFLQSMPFPLTLIGWSETHVIKGETDSYYGGATGIKGIASSPSAVFGYTFGVVGENNGWQGCGVRGNANNSGGPGYGVWGVAASTSGNGVVGQATAASGSTYGVVGESFSPNGRGVFGSATATSGATIGVYGQSNSPSGQAVYGLSNTASGGGDAVFGQSSSTSGRGSVGYATAGSGTTYGVWGQADSPSGRGVYGLALATTGNTYGVHGRSHGNNGIGVVGQAVSPSGTTYGVYGVSDSPSGFDFFAAGGASVAYGGTSSRRWKRDIEPIGQPLDKLGRLRGVYFNWDAEHGGQHDVGMIAEEVGAVLPEIVGYEENGVDAIGMDYSMMTPLLVEAVNALRAEKDAQICEQQERIDVLIARLERLEKVMSQTGHARKGAD